MTAIDLDKRLTALEAAARGLLDGGADLLLVETVFYTLNARAALFAIVASIDGTVVKQGATLHDRTGHLSRQ